MARRGLEKEGGFRHLNGEVFWVCVKARGTPDGRPQEKTQLLFGSSRAGSELLPLPSRTWPDSGLSPPLSTAAGGQMPLGGVQHGEMAQQGWGHPGSF